MTRLLYAQGKVNQHSWNRTLVGSDCRPGGFLGGKKFLICQELKHIYTFISLLIIIIIIIIIILQLAKQSAKLSSFLPDCQYGVRLLHSAEERRRFVKDRENDSRTHGSQELVLSIS